MIVSAVRNACDDGAKPGDLTVYQHRCGEYKRGHEGYGLFEGNRNRNRTSKDDYRQQNDEYRKPNFQYIRKARAYQVYGDKNDEQTKRPLEYGGGRNYGIMAFGSFQVIH